MNVPSVVLERLTAVPRDEQLARWLHEALDDFAYGNILPWNLLGYSSQAKYLHVARKLLTGPPACLGGR